MISGKADIGCNVQRVPKALILKLKKEVIVNRKGNKESDLSAPVLGVGLLSSGPHVVMGHIEDLDGPAETKNLMDQGEESLLFQHGPMMSSAKVRSLINKAKSPNRKKAHAQACKLGKENVGRGTSNVKKVNTLEEIT